MAKNEHRPDQTASYVTLGREAHAELIEKKSVFIGHASPVKTPEAAVAFIDAIRKQYADATHNVYAYMISSGQYVRYSDDGEPQGTAGVPVLDVIRKSGFTDAVIVVTRYFGGILLGAGGLVRAYSAAAKEAVDAAGIVSYRLYTELTLNCSYPLYQKLIPELSRFGVITDDASFDAGVTLRLAIRESDSVLFFDSIREISAGKCVPTVTGSRYGV